MSFRAIVQVSNLKPGERMGKRASMECGVTTAGPRVGRLARAAEAVTWDL